MKKVLLTIAVLVGLIAGAMMLSAFTTPTKEESVLEVTASPVWEGFAKANGAGGKYEDMFTHSNSVRIRVYPSDNSCGAYYAVKVRDNNSEIDDIHYTVKSNPDYDYRSTDGNKVYYYSHYITVGSSNYYFKM